MISRASGAHKMKWMKFEQASSLLKLHPFHHQVRRTPGKTFANNVQ
jgi:hypothetical protein